MNSKITILEIASVLTRKHGLEQSEAERFATAMFDVVKDALASDSQVKVKGLGTFKVVGVEARESVNISSGERFMIDSHEKITFTPDADMREMVNKPFSQFETVELKEETKDEVTTTSYQADEEPMDEQAIEEDAAEMPATEPEEPMAEPEEPMVEPEEPMAKPEEPMAKLEEPMAKPEEPMAETEASSASEAIVEEPGRERWREWMLWTVALIAVGAIAYYLGYRHGQHQQASSIAAASTETIERDTNITVQPSDTLAMTTSANTIATDTTVNTTPQATAADNATPTTATDTLADYKKYERMDARVRTGAYIIIGTDRVVTARSGDNLARVSRRELGEGMVCYVAVFNDMTDEQPLQVGQQIKIPKLKWKKKTRK